MDLGKEAEKPASRPPIKEILEEIRRLYNVAVDEPNRRKEFTQCYEPIRIGVDIDSERLRDGNVVPLFRRSSYGDLYALPIEGSISYAVVPRFALELQESNYESSAIGQVFDCPGYNPQENYHNMKAAKPAIFEFDPAKERWELKEKGELDLGDSFR